MLLAGVIAFATVQLSGDDTAESRSSQQQLPDDFDVGEPQPVNTVIPDGARKVAGEFILAAAGREDLAKAWKITHPDAQGAVRLLVRGVADRGHPRPVLPDGGPATAPRSRSPR